MATPKLPYFNVLPYLRLIYDKFLSLMIILIYHVFHIKLSYLVILNLQYDSIN